MKQKIISCILIMTIIFSYVPVMIPKVEAIAAGDTWSYGYTGGVQTFTVPATGTYSIEALGAQGGNGSLIGGRFAVGEVWDVGETIGRKGSYQSGYIHLQKGDVLYIYCGGAANGATGGWNGGGNGLGEKHEEMPEFLIDGGSISETTGFSAGGGGATDIRINGMELSNRILVAGGGAGGGYSGYVGYTNDPGYKKATAGGHAEHGFEECSNGILGQGSDYNHLETTQSGNYDHRWASICAF